MPRLLETAKAAPVRTSGTETASTATIRHSAT